MTLCVYALTDCRPLRPGVRGIAGERLTLIPVGPIAAVAGRLARLPDATVATLRRYDAVLQRLTSVRAAVLPARFGTCFASADELVMVLHARRQPLRRAVGAVRHRAQMTVRILGRSPAPSPEPRAPNPESRAPSPEPRAPNPEPRAPSPESRVPSSGRQYLQQRAAAAARAREIPGFEPVRAAVRRWVRDERVETRAGVTSVYHLVPRAAAEAYRRALDRAAAAQGLRIAVSGPWPPYAFAAEEP